MLNTLLPYADYVRSAECLDRYRLGLQRKHVIQILGKAKRVKHGYKPEPIVQMWMPYLSQLSRYGCVICNEWTNRGFEDNCKKKIVAIHQPSLLGDLPEWFGTFTIHRSHQSFLLREYPDYYKDRFNCVLNDLPVKFLVFYDVAVK